jgi:ribonuclease-3
MQDNLEEFENKLGYKFKDRRVLIKALTHSSFANEAHIKGCESNERLEFLGDAVLGIVTADYLYFHNAHVPEGELTRLRAMMVCEKTLHTFAQSIDLGKYLMTRSRRGAYQRARTSVDTRRRVRGRASRRYISTAAWRPRGAS